MGKVSNERRRKLFAELRETGKLVKPAIRTKIPKVVKPKFVVVGIEKESPDCYCRSRYPNNLPSGFRSCIDCPLTRFRTYGTV